jgi:hypothetical protein
MLIYSSALIAGQDLIEGLGPELLVQEVGLLEPDVKNRQEWGNRVRPRRKDSAEWFRNPCRNLSKKYQE